MVSPNDQEKTKYAWHHTIGLIGGPVLALGIMLIPHPAELPGEGWAVAAVGALMAMWWMTEAVPLATTALLPLVLFPLFGVGSLEATARSYAHPLIFLFLGGFMLARAMERWQLHKRLALHILRLGGSEPAAIIASLMLATAFLSMWVSNTATAMVMLPIGLSIVATMHDQVGQEKTAELTSFSAALMLGIAYAATIGGMGTLIGTPPNALFAGFMRDSHGVTIGFAQWMLLGIPVVVILLPMAWFVLTRVAFRFSLPPLGTEGDPVAEQIMALGSMSRGEKLMAALMGLVAAGWIFRPALIQVFPEIALSDAGIAIAAAILLFVIPVRHSEGVFLLSWKEAVQIRWDVLILFGGGLALAGAISSSGLAVWIGDWLAALGTMPVLGLVLVTTVVVVYLGELASNTAIAAIFLPIAGATAVGMGESPLLLALPVALAASLGFMLPVATPPNAIIFGSGAVKGQQMLRAGAILDIVCIVVVTLLAVTLGRWVFGLG